MYQQANKGREELLRVLTVVDLEIDNWCFCVPSERFRNQLLFAACATSHGTPEINGVWLPSFLDGYLELGAIFVIGHLSPFSGSVLVAIISSDLKNATVVASSFLCLFLGSCIPAQFELLENVLDTLPVNTRDARGL